MYRRPRFLEILDEVRQEMSREADYDVDLFAELVRAGKDKSERGKEKGENLQTFPFSHRKDLALKTKR